jgi:hypothetical protein
VNFSNKTFLVCALIIVGCACGKQTAKITEQQPVAIPEFNADSAFQYTAAQTAFGPRVPNTAAHEACADYLANKLKSFGAETTLQETTLHLADNTPIEIKNIIGSFQPENPNRILLCAHWDSRPFADHDANPANHNTPIDGANDGAGACAVLLEIARQIGFAQPAVGIDIIFFDAEDWGAHHADANNLHHGNWCMGSEYWAKNPHKADYTANFGILLDMVSGHGAQFYKEYFSMQFAPNIVKKVWNAAQAAGYGQYFPDQKIGGIEDDHIQVNMHRKIPCIDIIQYNSDNETGFADFWHTLNDNIDSVDKEILKAVGQTVLYVIYKEK